jgi:hypothetical protein
MLSYLKKIEKNITDNKLFLGFLLVCINFMSRNVNFDISPFQKQILNSDLVKQLFIFFISFVGTKDLKVSIVLTTSFYILSNHLLHEDSPFNIIPDRLKNAIDTNNDNKLSQQEIDDAINILVNVRNNNYL